MDELTSLRPLQANPAKANSTTRPLRDRGAQAGFARAGFNGGRLLTLANGRAHSAHAPLARWLPGRRMRPEKHGAAPMMGG